MWRKQHGIRDFYCPPREDRILNNIEREYLRRGIWPPGPANVETHRDRPKRMTQTVTFRRSAIFAKMEEMFDYPYIRNTEYNGDMPLGVVTAETGLLLVERIGDCWLIDVRDRTDAYCMENTLRVINATGLPHEIVGERGYIRVKEYIKPQRRDVRRACYPDY